MYKSHFEIFPNELKQRWRKRQNDTTNGVWVHENSSGSFAYLANRIAYRRGAWNFARRIAVPSTWTFDSVNACAGQRRKRKE